MSMPSAADAVAANVRGRMKELSQATAQLVEANRLFGNGVRITMGEFLQENSIFAPRVARLRLDLGAAAHSALGISRSAHSELLEMRDVSSSGALIKSRRTCFVLPNLCSFFVAFPFTGRRE